MTEEQTKTAHRAETRRILLAGATAAAGGLVTGGLLFGSIPAAVLLAAAGVIPSIIHTAGVIEEGPNWGATE